MPHPSPLSWPRGKSLVKPKLKRYRPLINRAIRFARGKRTFAAPWNYLLYEQNWPRKWKYPAIEQAKMATRQQYQQVERPTVKETPEQEYKKYLARLSLSQYKRRLRLTHDARGRFAISPYMYLRYKQMKKPDDAFPATPAFKEDLVEDPIFGQRFYEYYVPASRVGDRTPTWIPYTWRPKIPIPFIDPNPWSKTRKWVKRFLPKPDYRFLPPPSERGKRLYPRHCYVYFKGKVINICRDASLQISGPTFRPQSSTYRKKYWPPRSKSYIRRWNKPCYNCKHRY